MIKISTITIPKFSSESGSTPEKQKQLAEEIRSKIIAGADFATMAKTYSQDSRADSNGEWPWMETKALNPSMRGPALETKDGGVAPIIDEAASYIIIYVEAKKLGDMPPLDQSRPDIEKMIKSERGKGDVDKWMESLKKKAVIRKF
jgi:parvulin-like peptidyl-prolyl isomerase